VISASISASVACRKRGSSHTATTDTFSSVGADEILTAFVEVERAIHQFAVSLMP